MSYSEKLIDHFENPRNVGSLDKHAPNVGTGLVGVTQDEFNKLCRHDPDFLSGTTTVAIFNFPHATLTNLNKDNLQSITLTTSSGSLIGATGARQVRRLTQFSSSFGGTTSAALRDTPNRNSTSVLLYFASIDGASNAAALETALTNELTFSYAVADDVGGGTTAASSPNNHGVVHPGTSWGLEGEELIPEIDIKIEVGGMHLP